MNAPTVIDVDGHVFEPDELWERHLPSAFHDRRPRIVRDERGTTRYEIEGRQIPPGVGVGAWVPEGIVEASVHRDGAIDPRLRLADMDVEGIDVAVLYGTASLGFWGITDRDLGRACCRAYNDWLAEYCSADPTRLKGTPALPLASLDDTLDEARRTVTELGFVSITVPCCVGPQNLDDPDLDPLWRLAEELDVPVGVHAGGPRFAHRRFVDAYATLHALEFAFDIMFAAATLVCGGVLERFRALRVLLLEAGAAWGPYLFERLDEHYEKRSDEMPGITKRPSEYLADGRLVVSCEAERHLGHALAGLGDHAVVFASDYPHWDAEFPNSVRAITSHPDLDEDQKAAVLGINAARVYGWTMR
ncbi:MAG TPA: amidohydrolase family protein [Cellulomonadaceae bacterium]|nr:amidohydrolase family protein [Cellulomonadaceae bacterium]